MATHVIDLAIVVPSIFLAAVWLIRERRWGDTVAGVVLVLGATLAAPIGLTTLLLLTGDTVTVSPAAAFFTFLPIVVSAALAVKYVLSMESGDRRSTADGDRR